MVRGKVGNGHTEQVVGITEEPQRLYHLWDLRHGGVERGDGRAVGLIHRDEDERPEAESDRLRVDDPTAAATELNWLVMGEPVNRAMLLGDAASPTAVERAAQVRGAVRVFLAAYGAR